jgi:hypothetical protein
MELEADGIGGERLLQPARHGGAMDQGRQRRNQVDAAVMPHLRGQRRPPPAPCAGLQPRQLHADASDAKAAEPWSLTSLREKLIKIGAKVVSHGRYVTLQMAEVAVPRPMFAENNPPAHCPAAGTTRASMRGAGVKWRQATTAKVRLDSGEATGSGCCEAGNPTVCQRAQAVAIESRRGEPR